jgi:MOSC domain-containing protein YiiM
MVPLPPVVGKTTGSNDTLDFDEVGMPRLLSVNVGLPRDVTWNGKTVRTSICKSPVDGRRMVHKLDIDGDAQADLAGHGGEHRAVFVYQMDSYHYWERFLGRNDFTFGQFGENFTVEGLPDSEVCIGDRYRIGGAIFEVTQPRVTCYRVGIRMNEPRMAACSWPIRDQDSTFGCCRKERLGRAMTS